MQNPSRCLVVVQFLGAALSERRILLKKTPSVRARRDSKTKLNYYRVSRLPHLGCCFLTGIFDELFSTGTAE
jgi:hypothetical protein